MVQHHWDHHAPSGGHVSLYAIAMQVFCGMLARLTQFADVLRDSREQLSKVSMPAEQYRLAGASAWLHSKGHKVSQHLVYIAHLQRGYIQ